MIDFFIDHIPCCVIAYLNPYVGLRGVAFTTDDLRPISISQMSRAKFA